jgi:proteasome lid subunit RPN8/RPN11
VIQTATAPDARSTTPDRLDRLAIAPRQMVAIRRHSASAYPEECCGFLLGHSSGGRTVVERVLPAMNERSESRSNRFLIRPETVLAAQREANAAKLDIVGYYHSHPDHPAEPSETDRAHAWPGLSYLIVPVAQGLPGEPRSWRLTDDRETYTEESLEEPGAAAAAMLQERRESA